MGGALGEVQFLPRPTSKFKNPNTDPSIYRHPQLIPLHLLTLAASGCFTGFRSWPAIPKSRAANSSLCSWPGSIFGHLSRFLKRHAQSTPPPHALLARHALIPPSVSAGSWAASGSHPPFNSIAWQTCFNTVFGLG